ncbi:MAG: sugar nucleotide-binding protein [Verrucomicrobiota bacterium]
MLDLYGLRKPVVAVLGASGYIGTAFVAELKRRDHSFIALSRGEVDYTRFDELCRFLISTRPDFVINAAGFAGRPNVDACETARAETIFGNCLLPQTMANACVITGTHWGHVSSGCIFNGAKIETNGQWQVEPDLNQESVRFVLSHFPERVHGFEESDRPNFSFRHPPCSFYSGSKALAEEALAACTEDSSASLPLRSEGYIWRLRMPFDEFDHPRNYLSKLLRYERLYDNFNSLSHRGDFVRACLDLWERQAPFGIYNVTNPGYISTREVVKLMEQFLEPNREFPFWENDAEFYRYAARAPRSNCVLDSSRLRASGVHLRRVDEALRDALENWLPEKPTPPAITHNLSFAGNAS